MVTMMVVMMLMLVIVFMVMVVVRVVAVRSMGVPVVRVVMTMVVAAVPVVMVTVRVVVVMPLGLLQKIRIDVERRIERGGALVERQQLADLGHWTIEQLRHRLQHGARPFIRRAALPVELPHGAQHDVEFLDEVDRQTHGA